MDKLKIFCCQRHFNIINKLIIDSKFDSVFLIPMENCNDNIDETYLNSQINELDINVLLVENNHFKFNNGLLNDKIEVITYGISKEISNFLDEEGIFYISYDFLNDWKSQLVLMGYSKETASLHFQKKYRKMLFFDEQIDEERENKLKELSLYLQIDYVIVLKGNDELERIVNDIINKWYLQTISKEKSKSILSYQKQCADYVTILNYIGNISEAHFSRDIIFYCKKIFVDVMGADEFHYADYLDQTFKADNIMKKMINNPKQKVFYYEESKLLYLKFSHQKNIFGFIISSFFSSFNELEKYFSYVSEIVKICDLTYSKIFYENELVILKEDTIYKLYHDQLTSLYNKTYLIEKIFVIPRQKGFSVFYFDIDLLKRINDLKGHIEGDNIILELSNVLKKCFRQTDLIIRYGGDEFVVIIDDDNHERISLIENRVIKSIKENPLFKKHKVSVSYGLSISKQSFILEDIINEAKEQMGKSKIRESAPKKYSI